MIPDGDRKLATCATKARRRKTCMANIQNFEIRSNLPVNTPRLNVVSAAAFLAPAAPGALARLMPLNSVRVVVGAVLGFLLAQAPKTAPQWRCALALRLGQFIRCRGPGICWL